MGFFGKISEKLHKTKENFTDKIHEESIKDEPVNDEYLDFVEELLIESDFGVKTTRKILDNIEKGTIEGTVKNRREAEIDMRNTILSTLSKVEKPLQIRESPFVILVVGINGSGKTTTIGKLASLNADKAKRVMLVAADTFRAAAVEQLEIWSKRAGADIVKQQENADAAAVAFDGVKSGTTKRYDLIFVDTAGRLHTQKNLMEEIKKVKRAVSKAYDKAPQEVLLVLDSTIGQNAINQAKEFNRALDITGIVLTKMDGTAKGGVIVAISEEMNIPIRYIGMGESVEDLKAFNARDFVESVFVP